MFPSEGMPDILIFMISINMLSIVMVLGSKPQSLTAMLFGLLYHS